CFECGKTVGPADGSFFPDPDAVSQWVESMTDRGLRVLAFARREMPPGTTRITHADVAAGVEFLGLQGMIDPPRPEAVAAVAACKAAGIGVKMITGDHAGTAAAIARQIGLCESGGVCPAREVLTGREIAEMDDEKLAAAADSTAVFARVSPEQKLRLVKALQKGSRVVAMTGDGVNDAPALRQADIGVAMGMAGTEVSREAADMVLTDDNFATIEAAVEEGRAVFDNLVKFIVWALPTNGGMGLIIMASVLTGIVLPILPLQILWINMTTAGVLGLTLAFEPREPGIMGRPPRHPDMPVLTRPLILRIFFVSLLLVIGAFGLFGMEMMLSDGNEALARTLAVNVFVFGELFFLFNCRSTTHPPWAPGFWSNPFLWAGIALMSLLQVVYTYVPAFNKIFKSAPMGATEWGLVLAAGLAIFVLVEIEKWVRRRSGHRP
ncbi:MAG: HAD-IC family P-type ATPase, partial [Thermodesulfobacteriota bacterium]